MNDSANPRFLADAMVGKLARWLRVLGVDVLYDPSLDDHELLELARREKRVLLTRDTPLAAGGDDPPRLFIDSGDFRCQLIQVTKAYGLDSKRATFTRCVDCNNVLEPVTKNEVRDRVPPYVFSTQLQFKRCPGCDKILWGGTHREAMQKTIEEIFGQ